MHIARRTSRRWWLAGAAVLVVGVVAAAALFQPWRLLIDVEVRDADPFAAAAPPAMQADEPAPPTTAAGPAVVAGGSLTSIAHSTAGSVRLGRSAEGPVLFLDELQTDNGPDVRVVLSREPAGNASAGLGTGSLELGLLKGNVGDQVYPVPADADLGAYRSVVIWCERFAVAFGAAPLEPV